MSFKKDVYKRLGLKREKVTGSFIEDAPSVAGLRCVRGIPFVKPIEASTKLELTLDDLSFESTMRGEARKLVVKNASGTARLTYELRLVERGLPMTFGGWKSTDKPMKDIIDDTLKFFGAPSEKNRKPAKAKRRKP